MRRMKQDGMLELVGKQGICLDGYQPAVVLENGPDVCRDCSNAPAQLDNIQVSPHEPPNGIYFTEFVKPPKNERLYIWTNDF